MASNPISFRKMKLNGMLFLEASRNEDFFVFNRVTDKRIGGM